MPLEIRELVIKTSVNSDRTSSSSNTSLSEADQAAIVAACIDQVLSILQSRSER